MHVWKLKEDITQIRLNFTEISRELGDSLGSTLKYLYKSNKTKLVSLFTNVPVNEACKIAERLIFHLISCLQNYLNLSIE